ncbi:G0/G1 switch protein 2-like [Eleutherodactylus coqui]
MQAEQRANTESQTSLGAANSRDRPSGLIMETMHELIPFAKEMLSQKPNKKLVKMYVLGSVLAFFGVVIGLVETICSPFSGGEDPNVEDIKHSAPSPAPAHLQKKEEVLLEKSNPQVVRGRSLANRGHAS